MNKAHRYYYTQAHKINLTRNEPVMINDFSLRVGNRLYPLDEISKYDVGLTIPSRTSGILTLALGITFFALSVFKDNYLYAYIPSLSLLNKTISGDAILQASGVALSLFGMLRLALTRKFYVLRIVMGAEEMDVLARRKKSQLTQIASALHRKLYKSQSSPRSDDRPYTWAI